MVELLHHLREVLARLLLQIGDCNTSGQRTKIEMLGGKRRRIIGRVFVELDGRDSAEDAVHDVFGDYRLK